MTVLFERLSLLCRERQIKFNTLEKELGFSTNYLQKWENSVPGSDKVLKIADYFDVSTDYLLGKTDNPLSHKNSCQYDEKTIKLFKEGYKKLTMISNESRITEQLFHQLIQESHLDLHSELSNKNDEAPNEK